MRPGPPPHETAPPSGRYRYFVAGMLALVLMFSFMDRQLLSILSEPIRKDLGLSDTQLGLLTGPAFAIFYTAAGLPVAALADRWGRVTIVWISCALWSLFSALSGVAVNFASLFGARIGLGVGEAGCSPPSYSVIADYFPPDRRGLGIAIYNLGIPLGAMAGAVIGAGVSAAYGWRMAFFAISLPGVLLALAVALTVREPPRGAMDAGAGPSTQRGSMLGGIAAFSCDPVLVLTALSAAGAAFVSFGIMNWIPALLLRERGMTLSQLAVFFGPIMGAGGIVGTLASGFLCDRLRRHTRMADALVPFAALLVGLVAFVFLVRQTSWPPTILALAVLCITNSMWLTPAHATVQARSPSERRSLNSAIVIFAVNLIGLSGGPVFVGIASDYAKTHQLGPSIAFGLTALIPAFLAALLLLALTAAAMRRRAQLQPA